MHLPSALLAVALGGPVMAQLPIPQSAAIEWTNFRVIMSPDSSGSFVWTLAGPPDGKPRMFASIFGPANISTWTVDARDFLVAPLVDGDTGEARISASLTAAIPGARVYLARRKVQGKWTDERFISFDPGKGKEPVLISGTTSSIGEIIDSLAAIGRRTPFSPSALEQALAEAEKKPPETHASARPENRPPRYPLGERQADVEGTVLLRFAITPDGRVDMSSVKVLHTTTPAFLKAVLDAMPAFRFNPARRAGVAEREEVVMPFSFFLKRPR